MKDKLLNIYIITLHISDEILKLILFRLFLRAPFESQYRGLFGRSRASNIIYAAGTALQYRIFKVVCVSVMILSILDLIMGL